MKRVEKMRLRRRVEMKVVERGYVEGLVGYGEGH